MKTVFELFDGLEKEGFSGEVDVTASQGHATVYIKEGRFVWAHRPLDRAIERFQKISWMKMPDSEALLNARSWHSFVGLLLAENQEQYGRVVSLLKVDRLEVFFRIFFWTNLEIIPRGGDLAPLDATELGFYSVRKFDRLLTEAKKRVEEWPKMKTRMGSSRRIFISQVETSSLQVNFDLVEESFDQIADGVSPKIVLPHVPFSSEEVEILKICDGRNTVQDLIRILPDGEFLIVRRLLELWRKGAIRPKDDEESLVSIHTRSGDIGGRDIFASIWMIILISLCFFTFSELSRPDAPSNMPQEITQAVEIYRKLEGHYPLTLSDLPKNLINPKRAGQDFEYSLSDPLRYEIKAKTRSRN
ncbi:MAG: hypothetical protein JWQ35_1344 [Bacteriovoracaceae bacterium]|nr:hypothetical protein [Bacteriovoracaceae bacterium]